MTAPNHALTGALIGLTITNPALALPVAFLSHFVCDAIPHYDPPVTDKAERIGSKRFFYEFLLLGAGLCGLLVLVLALTRPRHWLLAAVCAFLATSPDLFSIRRFVYVKRTGNDLPRRSWFGRVHSWIQWRTGPKLLWLELAWFAVGCSLLITHL